MEIKVYPGEITNEETSAMIGHHFTGNLVTELRDKDGSIIDHTLDCSQPTAVTVTFIHSSDEYTFFIDGTV